MKKFFVLMMIVFQMVCYASKHDDYDDDKDFRISIVLPQEGSKPTYREFKSGEEAIKWYKQLYEGIKFTQEDKDIVKFYTDGHFVLINQTLRNGNPLEKLTKEEQEQVKKLDEALSKTIVFQDLITYRYETLGLLTRLYDKEAFELQKIYTSGKFTPEARHLLEGLSGKKYKDYGFMSTTVIRNSTFQTRPIELVIKVPRFSHALFASLKDFAAFPTQYELLFPRDRLLIFEKYEVSKDMKRLTIYAMMAPLCWNIKDCPDLEEDNIKKPYE